MACVLNIVIKRQGKNQGISFLAEEQNFMKSRSVLSHCDTCGQTDNEVNTCFCNSFLNMHNEKWIKEIDKGIVEQDNWPAVMYISTTDLH
jgi:hypothetical protein